MAGHSHHDHAAALADRLKLGIILTAIILAIELVGGLISNSLALLSDAGHVLADVIALSLSWYAVRQAQRPASHRMTFGYHRVGVIIALVNAASIVIIAGIIFYEAFRRIGQPPEVDSAVMLGIAILGLGINLLVAYWLRSEQKENINVRSAFWHVLGDALASVGVIIGGLIIMLTGQNVVDVIISIVIGIILIAAAWGIFREGIQVLLEATPKQIDVSQMIKALKQVPGVRGVYDVHVWSISPQIHAMSSHVLIKDCPTSQASVIRQRIENVLSRFHINHTTIQMECELCKEGDVFCRLTAIPEETKTPPHEDKSETEDIDSHDI